MTIRVALLLAVAALFLGGCGSDTPQATADQKKAFAGGPMPESWKAKMANSQSSKTTPPAKGP